MVNTKIKELQTEKDVQKLIALLTDLKNNTEFYIRTFLSGYTIYKCEENVFQLDNTANGWITAIATTEQLALFMCNKIDFDFFEWK